MDEPHRQLRETMREAVATGGPAAAFEVLSGMGVVVEKEPEAGVSMRMRFGAGTDESFTSTLYAASSERPAGWPVEVPFLPDVPGSLTLFEPASRFFSVQWWKVANPDAAAQFILGECLATGWQVQDIAEPGALSRLPGMHTLALERDDLKRVLTSGLVRDFGFVQLIERRKGESCSVAPPQGP